MSKLVFSVRVPATSANLGPGFDCLGIALEMFNTMTVYSEEPFAIDIVGESFEQLPRTHDNLVVQAMDKLFHAVDAHRIPEAYRLVLHNQIPIASGLGSSATAIVGGLLLANEMVRHYEPEKALASKNILRLATEMEGHPDNVSAALYGGGSLTWNDGQDVRYIRIPLPSHLLFVPATPYFPLLTETSRNVVPKEVSREDAIYNIAQSSRLMIALATGNLDLLRGGFGDKLHE